MSNLSTPTAAVLVIGNEILSGRTQDTNINAIAKKLVSVGIKLAEARVVADIEAEIVTAVNALRARYTYVFTTGGIGATHDDITADCVAKAFGLPLIQDPEARARLTAHYTVENLTEVRLRMARIPQGAKLIDNPVSAAPGFQVENVYVMAGVPDIMKAMLDGVVAKLQHGPAIHSIAVAGLVPENKIAEELQVIAESYPQIDVGSYPWFRSGKWGTSLVSRGTDQAAVKAASEAIFALLAKHGGEPVVE